MRTTTRKRECRCNSKGSTYTDASTFCKLNLICEMFAIKNYCLAATHNTLMRNIALIVLIGCDLASCLLALTTTLIHWQRRVRRSIKTHAVHSKCKGSSCSVYSNDLQMQVYRKYVKVTRNYLLPYGKKRCSTSFNISTST